ncbi:MAG: hypothetical protein JNJ61_29630, partial [Anaerolineae bacterium]|nr:hypothetical protein [Anaerolineae bacterium]
IVTVRDNDVAEKVVSLVSGIAGVVNVAIMEQKGGRSRVRIDFTGDDDGVAAINQKLISEQVSILGFTEETKDLEAMFMRVTKGIVT